MRCCRVLTNSARNQISNLRLSVSAASGIRRYQCLHVGFCSISLNSHDLHWCSLVLLADQGDNLSANFLSWFGVCLSPVELLAHLPASVPAVVHAEQVNSQEQAKKVSSSLAFNLHCHSGKAPELFNECKHARQRLIASGICFPAQQLSPRGQQSIFGGNASNHVCRLITCHNRHHSVHLHETPLPILLLIPSTENGKQFISEYS